MQVVRAQARFENLPALADHFETPACRFAVAIVSSQVAKRLFALKDRGRFQAAFAAIGTRRLSARYRHFGKLTSIAHAENPCACAQKNASSFRRACCAVSPSSLFTRAPISRARLPSK